MFKALSTLSQKSATVAESGEITAKFGHCRTFLRQCGQAFSRPVCLFVCFRLFCRNDCITSYGWVCLFWLEKKDLPMA